MGLSSKTQKQTQTTSSSTTPTNAPWATDALENYTGKVAGLLDQDPSSVIPGADPLQTQAATGASNLGGWSGVSDQARQLAQAASAGVGASSLLSNLQSYMNPYLDSVVDTSLRDFDDTAAQKAAQMEAAGAKAGAFGGSRFGVAQGTAAAQALKDRASLEAGLRSDAFNTSAQLSNLDADRKQSAATSSLQGQLQAAGLLGSLANSDASNARSDVATQYDVGTGQRGIATDQSDIGLLGAIGQLLQNGQLNLFHGEDADSTGTGTVKSNGGLLGAIGGGISAASSAASLFSDARLKRDVETLGHDDRGRRWVAWRYLWDDDDAPKHMGVMAQEIADSDPDAVVEGPLGFLMVDYSKLEVPTWLHS